MLDISGGNSHASEIHGLSLWAEEAFGAVTVHTNPALHWGSNEVSNGALH